MITPDKSFVNNYDIESLKSRVSLTSVYSYFYPAKFANQKRSGAELFVQCCYHEPDNNPSLTLNDSKGQYLCRAYDCGAKGDIFTLVGHALGLDHVADFKEIARWIAEFAGDYVPPTEIRIFPARPDKKPTETITRYEYGGGFVNERHDPINAKKYFKQFYNGVKHDKLIHPKFPMYRQSECADAVATGSIWIHDHEGEKCTDFAWELGYPSTTTYGNMRRDEYLETYQGLKDAIGKPFKVVIYQDAQDGERKAQYKAETLTKLGIEYKVLDWTKYLDKKTGDIVDYVEEHGVEKFAEILRKELCTEKPKNNIVALPSTKKQIDLEELRLEFLELLESNPKASEISKFKASKGLTPEQCRYVDALKAEYDRQQSVKDGAEQLKNLLSAVEKTIKLSDFLPERLAAPLARWAASIKVPESCLLTVMLPTMARFMGRSEIYVSYENIWSQPPNIFSCLVGQSGSKKSPIFKAIARNPIALLQAEIDQAYQEKKQEYEQWERLPRDKKKEVEEPINPVRFIWWVSNLTGEGLHYLGENFPEKGCLILNDEISGYFANQDRYTSGGKGGDNEEILGYYDGSGQHILRRTGQTGIDKFNVSIAGATQIDTLNQLMARRSTKTGEWARFLFCHLPYVPLIMPLTDSRVNYDFSEMLAGLYRNLSFQPETTYELSDEAYTEFALFSNSITHRFIKGEVDGSLIEVYEKARGQTARLALILHCCEAAFEGRTPDKYIGVEMVRRASALATFYISQAQLIRGRQDDNSLNPQLLKVVEILQKKGSLTPSEVTKAFSGKTRPSADLAKEMLQQLASMGLGVLITSGKNIKLVLEGERDKFPPERDKKQPERDKKQPERDNPTNEENPYIASVSDFEDSKRDKKTPPFSDFVENPPQKNQPGENLSRLSRLAENDHQKNAQTPTQQDSEERDKVITFDPKFITFGENLSRSEGNLSRSEEEQKEEEENALAVGIAEGLVQMMNQNTLTKKDVDKIMKDDFEENGFTPNPLPDSLKKKVWGNLTPTQKKKLKQIMGK